MVVVVVVIVVVVFVVVVIIVGHKKLNLNFGKNWSIIRDTVCLKGQVKIYLLVCLLLGLKSTL